MQYINKLHIINYYLHILSKLITANIHETSISYFECKFICINIGKEDIIIEKPNEVFRVALKSKTRAKVHYKC